MGKTIAFIPCFFKWWFSNIDLEMEKTSPCIHNAEEKDEYDIGSVKHSSELGNLVNCGIYNSCFNLLVWISQMYMKPK